MLWNKRDEMFGDGSSEDSDESSDSDDSDKYPETVISSFGNRYDVRKVGAILAFVIYEDRDGSYWLEPKDWDLLPDQIDGTGAMLVGCVHPLYDVIDTYVSTNGNDREVIVGAVLEEDTVNTSLKRVEYTAGDGINYGKSTTAQYTAPGTYKLVWVNDDE